MPAASQSTYTVVHIGAFDLASFGDQLYPLVAAHELTQRLGEVELLPFGPVGAINTTDPAAGTETIGTVHDGLGHYPCWALGPWSAERARELAQRATLVLCGGGEVVQGDGSIYAPFYGIDEGDARRLAIDRWYLEVLGPAEADCPVVWHAPGVPGALDEATAERLRAALADRALVAVRDERSRQFLTDAGVECPVEVVPDSALLLSRVLPPEQLEPVRARLVADGAFPAAPAALSDTDGSAEPDRSDRSGKSERPPVAPKPKVLVVQGNNVLADHADDLAAALDRLPDDIQVVTVAVSPCHDDHVFTEAIRQRLNRPSWNIPSSTSLEGITAAIAGADCFLGVSLHGAITAISYGRPTVTFDPRGQAKLASFLDLAGIPGRRATEPAEAVALAETLLTPQAGTTDSKAPGPLPHLRALQKRIDAHFDRIAALAEARAADQAAAGPPGRAPFTWSDAGATSLFSLRDLPIAVSPLPESTVSGLRWPDVAPMPGEVEAALVTAAAHRLNRRNVEQPTVRELAEQRRQNSDLRGAVAHLEGRTAELSDQLNQTRNRRLRLPLLRRAGDR